MTAAFRCTDLDAACGKDIAGTGVFKSLSPIESTPFFFAVIVHVIYPSFIDVDDFVPFFANFPKY